MAAAYGVQHNISRREVIIMLPDQTGTAWTYQHANPSTQPKLIQELLDGFDNTTRGQDIRVRLPEQIANLQNGERVVLVMAPVDWDTFQQQLTNPSPGAVLDVDYFSCRVKAFQDVWWLNTYKNALANLGLTITDLFSKYRPGEGTEWM